MKLKVTPFNAKQTIFITGIGTNAGKTLAAAILTEALEADYWKPVQAGFDEGTDAGYIQSVIRNKKTIIHPETYKLKLAASPHIAAKEEGIHIDLNKIQEDYLNIVNRKKSPVNNQLIIEGAGGLMVPLNEREFVTDLIKKLNVSVILVSRNYLGSINHSLLTAAVCKHNKIKVLGWVFNDDYLHYEDEIVHWSGYPKIASIPFTKKTNAGFITEQAGVMKNFIENISAF